MLFGTEKSSDYVMEMKRYTLVRKLMLYYDMNCVLKVRMVYRTLSIMMKMDIVLPVRMIKKQFQEVVIVQ